MRCLIWYCQGLGSPLTSQKLRELCAKYLLSTIFLFEIRNEEKLGKIKRRMGFINGDYMIIVEKSSWLVLWLNLEGDLKVGRDMAYFVWYEYNNYIEGLMVDGSFGVTLISSTIRMGVAGLKAVMLQSLSVFFVGKDSVESMEAIRDDTRISGYASLPCDRVAAQRSSFPSWDISKFIRKQYAAAVGMVRAGSVKKISKNRNWKSLYVLISVGHGVMQLVSVNVSSCLHLRISVDCDNGF